MTDPTITDDEKEEVEPDEVTVILHSTIDVYVHVNLATQEVEKVVALDESLKPYDEAAKIEGEYCEPAGPATPEQRALAVAIADGNDYLGADGNDYLASLAEWPSWDWSY